MTLRLPDDLSEQEQALTKKLLILIWLGVILIGLALAIASGGIAQRAKRGDDITVNYTLKLTDGRVLSTTAGTEPFQATLGKGMLVSGFEEAVIGMKPGENKTVTIPPEKGYGPRRPELIEVVDRSMLPEGVEPQVGQRLEAYGKDNKPFMVTIIAFDDQTVTADMNHPLAGQNLTFDIELLAIGATTRVNQPDALQLSWMLFGLGVLLIFGFIAYNRMNFSHSPAVRRTSRLRSPFH